jgi:hypothetical protein
MLDALRIYRGDARAIPRIEAAASGRGREIEAAWREIFR